MNRVHVKPQLIQWAIERASMDIQELAARSGLSKLPGWLLGSPKPTFKQLDAFAKAVRVPIGYLFLPAPPQEHLPIPDFRTVGRDPVKGPSPDLLDTIYSMQERQAWLREAMIEADAGPLAFVGSARLTDSPDDVGREMRRAIGFEDGWAATVRTWREAISHLRLSIERLSVMAVINGVVGNNTRRKLDVREFRGFALSDKHAPLIFVNGADAKSAQMFTLAHELAHVWLDSGGVSGFENLFPGESEVEVFCDRAAAEFLIPEREMKSCWPAVRRAPSTFEELARRFKVSPIVAGRRCMDLRLIDRKAYFEFYSEYTSVERSRSRGDGGGDFYNNQNTRVGAFFATHVIRAAMEGRLGFKQAYELTGLGAGTFHEYAKRLEFRL